MNKEPETYEELIWHKRCVDLTSYYELSKEDLEKIYNFMISNPNATAIGNANSISLKIINNPGVVQEIINAKCTNPNIDGLTLNKYALSIVPHYTPSSSSGSS